MSRNNGLCLCPKPRERKGRYIQSFLCQSPSAAVLLPCPSLLCSGKSFREQQCEKYNAYNHTDLDGNFLQWIPKYSGVSPRDRCKLFCRARGRSEFKVFEAKVRLSWIPTGMGAQAHSATPASDCFCMQRVPSFLSQVIDGTLCGPDTLSICVRGQCVKAGCDHVVNSPKKLDKCGVCGGKGITCRKVSGSFTPYRWVSEVAVPRQRDIKGFGHCWPQMEIVVAS